MEFHVLGPLEVISGGQPLAVGGARTRAVLAMLLINANRVVAGRPAGGRAVAGPCARPRRGQPAGPPVGAAPGAAVRRRGRSAGHPGARAISCASPPTSSTCCGSQQLAAAGREALAAGDAATAVRLLDRVAGSVARAGARRPRRRQFAGAERARLEEERLGALESTARRAARVRTPPRAARGARDADRQRTRCGSGSGAAPAGAVPVRAPGRRAARLPRAARDPDRPARHRARARAARAPSPDPAPGPRSNTGPPGGRDARAPPQTRYAESGGHPHRLPGARRGPARHRGRAGRVSHLDLLWEDPETAELLPPARRARPPDPVRQAGHRPVRPRARPTRRSSSAWTTSGP